MDEITFDASYLREIDAYFAAKSADESPDIPGQNVPATIDALIKALQGSHLPGRFEAGLIILSMNDAARTEFESTLRFLAVGGAEGRQRTIRLPFVAHSYGITISYAHGPNWQEEIMLSAAQLVISRCDRWIVVQVTNQPQLRVTNIRRIEGYSRASLQTQN